MQLLTIILYAALGGLLGWLFIQWAADRMYPMIERDDE